MASAIGFKSLRACLASRATRTDIANFLWRQAVISQHRTAIATLLRKSAISFSIFLADSNNAVARAGTSLGCTRKASAAPFASFLPRNKTAPLARDSLNAANTRRQPAPFMHDVLNKPISPVRLHACRRKVPSEGLGLALPCRQWTTRALPRRIFHRHRQRTSFTASSGVRMRVMVSSFAAHRSFTMFSTVAISSSSAHKDG